MKSLFLLLSHSYPPPLWYPLHSLNSFVHNSSPVMQTGRSRPVLWLFISFVSVEFNIITIIVVITIIIIIIAYEQEAWHLVFPSLPDLEPPPLLTTSSCGRNHHDPDLWPPRSLFILPTHGHPAAPNGQQRVDEWAYIPLYGIPKHILTSVHMGMQSYTQVQKVLKVEWRSFNAEWIKSL